MNRNPNKRLGSGMLDSEEIKTHPFFSDLDFNKIFFKKFKVPEMYSEQRSKEKLDISINRDKEMVVNPVLYDDMRERKKSDTHNIDGWSFIEKNSYKIKK